MATKKTADEAALAWVTKAVSTETFQRPVLSWVRAEGGITVASDQYRIHVYPRELPNENGWIRAPKSREQPENTRFPDWRIGVPSRHDVVLTAYTSDIVKGVRRAMVFARDNANVVHLTFHCAPGGVRYPIPNDSPDLPALRIYGKSPEHGDCETSWDVAARAEDKPFHAAYNGKYLLDALSGFDSGTGAQISLRFTRSGEFWILTLADDSGQYAVIMPTQSAMPQREPLTFAGENSTVPEDHYVYNRSRYPFRVAYDVERLPKRKPTRKVPKAKPIYTYPTTEPILVLDDVRNWDGWWGKMVIARFPPNTNIPPVGERS